jgi:hypothetical protein
MGDVFKHREVYTLAGVTTVDQSSSTVATVLNAKGDTIMDMIVIPGDVLSGSVTVHLDRAQAIELILSLSAMIADM